MTFDDMDEDFSDKEEKAKGNYQTYFMTATQAASFLGISYPHFLRLSRLNGVPQEKGLYERRDVARLKAKIGIADMKDFGGITW